MAVSRKAMTEGIRTFLFPGTPYERNLTIPQSAALTAPFAQGSRFWKKVGGHRPPTLLSYRKDHTRFSGAELS